MISSESKKIIKKWEIAGIIFMIIAGSLLHFVYEWSGYNPIVGLFAPVNESVWEHLKLGFTSLLIFSIIEYFFIRAKTKNFFSAKIAAALFQELFIVAVFYTYTFFTGKSILFIDISTFIVSCILGQYISYRILIGRDSRNVTRIISIILILINISSFMTFTYFTPTLPVFKDSNFNSYGTEWNTTEKNK
jgi:hypothetical protein